jgi:DNA-binding GntR family transcriptional regulator
MSRQSRTGLGASLAAQLAADIRAGRLASGDHLSAQELADRFAVSRSPIASALRGLATAGLLRHEPQKGYFVADPHTALRSVPPRTHDPVEAAYLALAEDRLDARLPNVVSTNALRVRYGLTQAQVQLLTSRVLGEGWLERRPGYGLQFTAMLDSADALLQTYRVRMALEPAALLEPGYTLDREGARACRQTEEDMLAGGVEGLSAEDLYERGVRFHEVIVAGSGNPFFLDALRRINRIRRLLAYRSFGTRGRYYDQARDHLEILDLLEAGRQEEASRRLRRHLGRVTDNLEAIRPILEPVPI